LQNRISVQGKRVFVFPAIFFTGIFLFYLQAFSDEIHINPDTDHLELGNKVFYLEDKVGQISIDAILNSYSQKPWKKSTADTLSFGYTGSAYWIKATLINDTDEQQSRLIEIAYPVLDYLDIYFVHQGKIKSMYTLGDKQPFSNRPIKHRHFVVPLEIMGHMTLELYFRAKTSSSMQLPLIIWKERTFLENGQKQLLGLGIYFGIMFVMAMYNIFIFFSVREISYFYYVLYVVSMSMFLASLNGLNFQYLWPNATIWNDESILVGLSGVCFFALLFVASFLNLHHTMPRLIRVYKLLIIYCVLMILGCFLIPYYISIRIVIISAVLLIVLAFVIGIIRWLAGDSSARFYTTAWVALFLGGVTLALSKFGFVADNFLTKNAVQFGSAIEVLFLSFALADRLNIEKKIRYEAQLAALENEKVARIAQAQALDQEKRSRLAQEKALKHEKEAREAQERALSIQKQANETLEQRVYERTRDLEKVNTKLKELSTTDGLTGLKNRRHFNEMFHYEFARAVRDKTPLALLMIDVDHFKNINDTFGHLIGDDCLKMIAETLHEMIRRECDCLSRYGGEEFCMLLPNTRTQGALHLAESIRLCVEKLKFSAEGASIPVTVSIGVVTEVPEKKEDQERFLNKADEALYISKQNGRNRVTIYETETNADRTHPLS